MDFPNSPGSPATAQAPIDLAREIRVLRLALSLTIVALVILSGSLGVYLFRQVVLLRRQVDATSRIATQAYQNYKDQVEPHAVVFERQLKEFARTNADFQIQIAKYFVGGLESPAGQASAPGTNRPSPPATAPATPAAPKPSGR